MIAAFFLSSAIIEDKTLKPGKNAPKIETVEGINVGYDANSEPKTRIISFWSPKNPTSRITNKDLEKLYGDNSNGEVEFISICTDNDEALMQEVMKVDGLEQINNYSYSQISPRVFKDYGVDENPKAFKIGTDGKIVEII